MRAMKPSIEGMSVQEERVLLGEIRQLGSSQHYRRLLSNGMYAGEFALLYVRGHHQKRQQKHLRKVVITRPDESPRHLECLEKSIVQPPLKN